MAKWFKANTFLISYRRRLIGGVSILIGGLFGFAKPAWAQNAGLENLSQAGVNLGNQDLIYTVARLINIGLGVLGVIAVLLILYAGFIWMTSRGNEEKITQAKKILSGAVIGLVIILVSFAVASFIINKLIGATGGRNGGGPVVCADGLPPPCVGFDRLQVVSTSPKPQAEGVKLCKRVQAQFNEKLDPGTVKNSAVRIVDTKNTAVAADDETVAGTFAVSNKSFSFRHPDFAPGSRYQATIASGSAGVKDIRNRSLREDKKWYFTTGTETDAVLPQVVRVEPAPASTTVCRNTPIQVVFSEEMDATTLNSNNIILKDSAGSVIPLADVDAGSDFKSVTIYAAAVLAANSSFTVTLKSGPDGIADACGNQLDGNKNGKVDGTPADDYSWSFTTGEITECKPVLNDLLPSSGYYGDETILSGKNFGITGEVMFNNFPADSNSWGGSDNVICWGSGACLANTIKVKVPVGFELGRFNDVAVKVKVGRESSADKPFALLSPYVRALSPNHGPPGQFITVFGLNFGTTVGTVKFGTVSAELACSASNSWSDREIVVKVPASLAVGDYEVQILTTANKPSNKKDFTVDNSLLAPGLCEVRPQCAATAGGAIDEIAGTRFGASRGRSVINLAGYNIAPTGQWRDNLIKTTPVPADLSDDNHLARVVVNNLMSNARYYDIPCVGVIYPEVVEERTCELETQTPSPWKDSSEACKNGLISARFTVPMAAATLAPVNIVLQKCGSGANFDASACQQTVNLVDMDTIPAGEDSNPIGFFAAPAGGLAANTWYQTTIKTAVTSSTGRPLRSEYKWHFKSRTDTTNCAINKVSCAPPTAYIRSLAGPDNTQAYNANAVANNCNLLNQQSYNYTWTSSDNSKATVSAGVLNYKAEAEAKDWTSADNPVKIKARIDSENKEGLCNLNISTTACRENKDCQACGPGVSSCVAGSCTPVIKDFSPADGAVGTWITIDGCYFGETQGRVLYTKAGSGTVAGKWPDPALCGQMWTNKQIISEAPATAATGVFIVERPPANEGQAVSPAAFTVNNNHYPGLCKVAPTFVYKNQLGTNLAEVTLTGKGFGGMRVTDDGVYYFKSDGGALTGKASSYISWADNKVVAVTPAGIAVGPGKIAVNKIYPTNKLNFEIKDFVQSQKPIVKGISPENGMARADIATTLITVSGENFGASQSGGQVWLRAAVKSQDWDNAKKYDFNSDKILNQADGDLLASKKGADVNYEEEQMINGQKVKVKINKPFDINNDGKIDEADKTVVVNYLSSSPFEHDVDYTLVAGIGCTWSDKEIVAKVPTGLTINETWRVYVKTSGGVSVYNNAIFTVSNIIHPGICSLTPNHGAEGTIVTINGLNFGDLKSNSQLTFTKVGGVVEVDSKYIKSWRNQNIVAAVPDKDYIQLCGQPPAPCAIKIKTGDVKVTVTFPVVPINYGGTQTSNPVTFTADPYITSITPAQGPAGSWLTIKGGNFGECSARGNTLTDPCVVTLAGSGGRVLEGALPSICGNTWTDSQIIAKAPSGGETGLVKVVNEQGYETSDSASKIFTYDSKLPIAPGLCKLTPAESGQLPVAVALQGDNFGSEPHQSDKSGGVKFSNKEFTSDSSLLKWSAWGNNSISLTAPVGTTSGEVYVKRKQEVQTGAKCNGITVAGKCLGAEEPVYKTEITVSNPLEFKISDKPKVVSVLPVNNQSQVCRNGLITVTFDRSLGGESPLTVDEFKVSQVCGGAALSKTNLSWFNKLTDRLIGWLWPIFHPVQALTCNSAAVLGSLRVAGKELSFALAAPLEPNATYRVQLNNNNIVCGVGCDWQFKTQDKICEISQVEVTPPAYTFTKAGVAGEKEFNAQAISSDKQELLASYSWDKSDSQNIVSYQGNTNAPTVTVRPSATNGQAILKALADGSAGGAGKKTGTANVEVFICDFPWEFKDADANMRLRYCRGNLSGIQLGPTQLLKNPDFESGLDNWNNSASKWLPSTTDWQRGATSAGNARGTGDLDQTVNTAVGQDYLLKGYIKYSGALKVSLGSNERAFSGVSNGWQEISLTATAAATSLNLKFTAQAGTVYADNFSLVEVTGLLPELNQPNPPFTRAEGDLIREYFFKVGGASDAIGLRVYQNRERLSPLAWYSSRSDIKPGNPQPINSVDGYEAIKDGNTYYVGAVKQDNNKMYTNIYVLSFNQGASSRTGNIIAKLLDGWRFNTDITNSDLVAALKRDLKRVNDLTALRSNLIDYKTAHNQYPQLSAGTFVIGQTTSVWPSWQSALGNDLGVALPTDPLNSFSDVGGNNLCSGSGFSEFNPATCWNSTAKEFRCPDNSHIYQYKYINGRAYLHANFEYKNVVWPYQDNNQSITVGGGDSCDSVKYEISSTPTQPRDL